MSPFYRTEKLMLNIYFKKRILSICTKQEVPVNADERFLLCPDKDYDISQIPFMMENNLSFQHLIVEVPENEDEKEFTDRLLSKVVRINAGGGLVTDASGNYLMIYRNGTWDLPKGMQEDGEDISLTAIREVEEESGVKAKPVELIKVTNHAYRIYGPLTVKSIWWYRMVADEKASTRPQTEEGIEKCEWVTPDDLDYRLANTYPSILDVFEAALKK